VPHPSHASGAAGKSNALLLRAIAGAGYTQGAPLDPETSRHRLRPVGD
jgi:hypothetical protein